MFKPDGNLRRLYNTYNAKFFDGELPKCSVGYAEVMASAKCWAQSILFQDTDTGVKNWVLALDPSLRPLGCFKRITLLHEMAHLRLFPYGGHGKKFDEEVTRLFLRGAFRGLI